jgi:amidase
VISGLSKYVCIHPVYHLAYRHDVAACAMSSTLPPDVLSPDNPIRHDTVTEILEKLGVTVPPQDVEVYTSLLTGIWEVWNNVEQMGDYVPDVDEDRFPRQEVHRATAAENAANAWAWKCLIKDTKPNYGLLAGRTICLKVSALSAMLMSQDTIAVKGVPCLLGTDMIKDWVPSTDATITTRILEAGGVITGKGVCENLCLWGLSNSAATGESSRSSKA